VQEDWRDIIHDRLVSFIRKKEPWRHVDDRYV